MTFLGCIPPNPFEVPLAEAIPLADQPHLLQVSDALYMHFTSSIRGDLWCQCKWLSLTLLFFLISQPNARKEDLFGRPSQGLYSSSYMASKGLTDLTVDMNCLQVNILSHSTENWWVFCFFCFFSVLKTDFKYISVNIKFLWVFKVWQIMVLSDDTLHCAISS